MSCLNLLKPICFCPTADGWGLPAAFVGEPGTAKTSIIKAFAASFKGAFECLVPSERGAGAFGVVPVPVGGYLTYPSPDWSKKFEVEHPGMVFIDEMNTNDQEIQRAIMGLTLGRRIGGKTLGGHVRILCAMNPPEHSGGADLNPAACNRLGWFKWAPQPREDWSNFMSSGTGVTMEPFDPRAEEAMVLAAWGPAYAKALGVCDGFLKARPSYKNQMLPLGQSGPWPSDRSWSYAVRARAISAVYGLGEIDTDTMTGAFVGDKVNGELRVFEHSLDLPDAAAVLDGNAPWEHRKERIDRTVAFFTECTTLVTAPGSHKRKERSVALWNLLAQHIDLKSARDLAVGPAMAMSAAKLDGDRACLVALAKLRPLMDAVGSSKK